MKLDTGVSIHAATEADREPIAALLRAANLPAEDLAPHLRNFLVARRSGVVLGAIGAEICGEDGLLRSLVVAGAERGRGCGGKLVEELERVAVGWGVRRWWLLTTTAAAFFEARGFRTVERAAVPASIATTEQFRGFCPSVAVCLSRERRMV